VVDKLQAMLAGMERQNRQSNERLVVNQESFQRDIKSVYTDLASAVDKSLMASLTESARAAGATIGPMAEATMRGIARETASLHDSMAAGLRQSLAAFTETLEQRSASLASSLQADLAQRDRQRLDAMNQSMEALATSLQQAWQQAGAQTLAQQRHICATLERTAQEIAAQAQNQASKTIGEIGQLMAAAAAAPRAAAEAISQLREQISRGMARDNELLEERSRIMATFDALLAAIDRSSAAQGAAVDTLVSSATTLLDRAGDRFATTIGSESARMAQTAAQVAGSAIEVSSLSDAFGFAVQQFGAVNEKMIDNLQRIEAALDKSMTRSDEQLAYYVAQAREIIDLSIMSQQQIVRDIQQVAGKQALRVEALS
jgi:hypothetical protein